jgi:hypothetical protein
LKYSSTFSSIQLKRGTSDRWLAKNPILLAGEVGLEVIENTPLPTTYKIKIGDGLNTWGNLPYYAGIDWTEAQVASTLSLISGNGVSLSQSDPPLMVGSSSNQNLAFDGNEIQSRNNGLASTLFLQSYGGNTSLGASNASNDSNLIVNGSLTMTNGSTLNASITSSGRLSTPRQPSFHARMNNVSGVAIPANTNLPFDSVVHNIGNHFNTSTRIFTAPVSGSYFFTFHVFKFTQYANGTNTYWGFRVNNAEILTTNHGLAGSDGGQSLSAVLYLNANDYVAVQHYGTMQTFSGPYNSFSGYFLG